MSLQLSESQLNRFQSTGVIAVMIVDDPDRAVSLAKALLDGGVDIMELTLRTAKAMECLSAIVKRVPEMLAGEGQLSFLIRSIRSSMLVPHSALRQAQIPW